METEKGIIKLSNYKKHDSNPFVEAALEQVKGKTVKKYRSATNTGEKAILQAQDDEGNILGHTSFIRQIEIDEDKFAKIYLSNFSQFYDLGRQAIRVFGYVMTKLVIGQDMFIFLLDECKEYVGIKSKAVVYKGLAQLVDSKIIARGPTDTLYYINPMVVFNGSRITFAKTYVKKRKKQIDPNQLEIAFVEPVEYYDDEGTLSKIDGNEVVRQTRLMDDKVDVIKKSTGELLGTLYEG